MEIRVRLGSAGIGRLGRQSANLRSEHLKSVLPRLLLVLLFVAGCRQPNDSSLSRVQEAGLLRVGLDPSWPPFEYVDPASGEVAGLDVDLARAIGHELGVEGQAAKAYREVLQTLPDPSRLSCAARVCRLRPQRPPKPCRRGL